MNATHEPPATGGLMLFAPFAVLADHRTLPSEESAYTTLFESLAKYVPCDETATLTSFCGATEKKEGD